MKSQQFILIIIFVGLLAWLPTLQNWFFRAQEATWLMGVSPHTFINLVRGHAFLYYLDLKIFGWNPWGWYLTAIILHISATIILFYFIKRISKNIVIAVVASVFFIANTSYHDVLTWGSYNSYYPMLLSSMLFAIYSYFVFRESGKRIFLVISLIFSFVSFLIRETGIVIVPLITIFELIFYSHISEDAGKTFFRKRLPAFLLRIKVSSFFPIIIRLAPFYLLLILFFLIWKWYGGIGGDYADSLVKWRVKLVNDLLFFELFYAMFLTSGKLLAPHLIPYPLLNLLRDGMSHFIPASFTKIYFFPIVGLSFYSLLGLFVYKIRHKKKYFRIALFFLVWILAFTVFVSLAVPNDHASLATDYNWNPMRYRYFAFVGTTILYGIFFVVVYEKYKKKFKQLYHFAITFVVFVIVTNILLLWKLESDIYKIAFEPSKKFYVAFKKEFPELPKNPTFYIYPNTSGLNDYMLEWYYIDGLSYYDRPYKVESQMEAVIDKVKSKKILLTETFFLDYNSRVGLINNTQKARKLISALKVIPLDFYKVSDSKSLKYEAKNFTSAPVEIPYNIGLKISSSLGSSFFGKKSNSGLFRSLVDYNIGKKEYMDHVRISTSYTMSQREGEPFYHVVPQNLIDGNYGFRSTWIADGSAWIIADIGTEEEIHAVIWGSMRNSIRIPARYSFFVSNDRKAWREVKKVKENKNFSAIDVFKNPEVGRFVKMQIYTTTQGDFAQLDELEVITSKNKDILNFYKDRQTLIEDSRNIFQFTDGISDIFYAKKRGLKYVWGRVDWETNRSVAADNDQFMFFWYPIDSSEEELTLPLKEAEVFAGVGQFLEKEITLLSFDFGDVPIDINVHSLKLVPKYK